MVATSSRRTVKPKGAAADVLRGIAEKKTARDQEALARQEREDAALQAYAAAVGAAVDDKAKISKRIARLQAQLDELAADAAAVDKKYEPDQAKALRALSKLGQSHDDIAAILPGLSVKRVRVLIKLAEDAEQVAPTAAATPKTPTRAAPAKGDALKATASEVPAEAEEAKTSPSTPETANSATVAP